MRRTAGEKLWQVLHPDDVHEAEVPFDRAGELRKKFGTELGQLWQIGSHRLLCGDSREGGSVQRLYSGEAFRLIIADPPYAVNYAAKNAHLNRADYGTRIQKPIENDSLEPEEAQSHFQECTKTSCSVRSAWRGLLCNSPLRFSATIFYRRLYSRRTVFQTLVDLGQTHFVLGMSDYHHRHEAILYGWLETGPHYFIDDRTQDSIFEVDRPTVSDLHPTTKPVELIARMLRNSTRPGEVVYDPFCGSGSTILAAHQTGRIGYGCEIDPGYLAVALERLSLLGQKAALVLK